MTEEQKYFEIIKSLAEVIAKKNEEIQFKGYELDRAKRLVEIAEKRIKELEKK